MSRAMQLKAILKRVAESKRISVQLVLQNYMLERLLERISVSDYQRNFILKGGFLIAAMVGLDTRATMDMDATLKGMLLSEVNVEEIFRRVCAIDLNDDVNFTIKQISEIRLNDTYNGFRISLDAAYPPMVVPLKVDITTGDRITPVEISYSFRLLLEPRSIQIWAYNLETVLAEKLETVLSRADQNTRPRDYYDIYIIFHLQWQNVNLEMLKKALSETTLHRGTNAILLNYDKIVGVIEKSEMMRRFWGNYQKEFDYANDITFEQVCAVIRQMMDELKGKE